MYTVGRAAELTGISTATLRMWERRYAVVSPERSPSGYRVYDDAAVRRLSADARARRSGLVAAAPAEQVKSGTTGGASDPAADVEVAPLAGAGDPDARVRVAELFDGAGLGMVLDRAFEGATFEDVVDGWLMPALHELGAAWHRGAVVGRPGALRERHRAPAAGRCPGGTPVAGRRAPGRGRFRPRVAPRACGLAFAAMLAGPPDSSTSGATCRRRAGSRPRRRAPRRGRHRGAVVGRHRRRRETVAALRAVHARPAYLPRRSAPGPRRCHRRPRPLARPRTAAREVPPGRRPRASRRAR